MLFRSYVVEVGPPFAMLLLPGMVYDVLVGFIGIIIIIITIVLSMTMLIMMAITMIVPIVGVILTKCTADWAIPFCVCMRGLSTVRLVRV